MAEPIAEEPRRPKTVEETYRKMTQREHVLQRPDTYIGSTETITQQLWVLDPNTKRFVNRPATFVPGLLKIIDEVVVNALDNKARDASMTKMEVTVDVPTNTIRVWNNGAGIPVVVHAEHGVYVPELIFGHMLASSCFDDTVRKVVGGRNGIGSKTANVFSTEFIVECFDAARGLKYTQTFRANMSVVDPPVIVKTKGKSDFTCITFRPDLLRFGMTVLDDDVLALIHKRVYDAAGVTDKSLRVFLNGEQLAVHSFKEYVGLYMTPMEESPVVFGTLNERWTFAAMPSPDGEFQQVSFVNGICTSKGGTHVAYIVDQITAAVVAVASKKHKDADLKAHQVKNHISVFINCQIENPSFDSQTKETLTTRPKDFGSTAIIPDSLMRRVVACGILDRGLMTARLKQTAALKKVSGTKKVTLLGIPKLDDANCAGGPKADKCTLILTEGDSAKTLAISGLSVVGRDYYGVFPLKGKLLNVREASHSQMMANTEIQNIVAIMGLQFGKEYPTTKGLRYGHLMVMADQDHDGSHIKGLIINLLHTFWPTLLRVRGFLKEFITPIVKCVRGAETKSFYTMPQYAQWLAAQSSTWSIKYYKGLGTSTSEEAQEYFRAMTRHSIDFVYEGPASDDAISLAFAKGRADDRKVWLQAVVAGTYVDYHVAAMKYTDFVSKELVLFSQADNVRSIPSVMDGLKPSQRKVLFGCLRRNLKKEIKVAQLAGYVSEHTAYHHGEQSLAATIIGMAQTFPGSNNLNLLFPSGQFGTREGGGKDAASPRYIFTRLSTITRKLFHPHDDLVLEQQEEDGQKIEPKWYAPIIPMVLVNGAEGIGTGWSTFLPTYSPRDIIAVLRARLAGDPVPPKLHPWFRGFDGTIVVKSETHFTAEGRASLYVANDPGAAPSPHPSSSSPAGTKTLSAFFAPSAKGDGMPAKRPLKKATDGGGDTLTITELPVRKWTGEYRAFLDTLRVGAPKPEKPAGGKDAAKTAATKPARLKNAKDGGEQTGGTPATAGKAKKPAASKKSKGGATPLSALVGAAASVDGGGGGSNSGTEPSVDGLALLQQPPPPPSPAASTGTGEGQGDLTPKRTGPIAPVSGLFLDVKNLSTDTTVKFVATLAPGAADALNTHQKRMKVLKLETNMSTTNIHLFDTTGRVKKYESPEAIVDEFFIHRLDLYQQRKDRLLAVLRGELLVLEHKVRFIRMVVARELVVSHKKRPVLEAELETLGFRRFSKLAAVDGSMAALKAPDSSPAASSALTAPGEGEEGDDGTDGAAATTASFQYLLAMPILALTLEKVHALEAKHAEKTGEVVALESTTPHALWSKDLDELEVALTECEKAYIPKAESTTVIAPPPEPQAPKLPRRKTDGGLPLSLPPTDAAGGSDLVSPPTHPPQVPSGTATTAAPRSTTKAVKRPRVPPAVSKHLGKPGDDSDGDKGGSGTDEAGAEHSTPCSAPNTATKRQTPKREAAGALARFNNGMSGSSSASSGSDDDDDDDFSS